MEKLSEKRLRKIEQSIKNPRPGSKVAAAEQFGVDLTLTAINLRLTPRQRIEKAEIEAARFENIRRQIKSKKSERLPNLPTTIIEIFSKAEIDFVAVGDLIAFVHGINCGGCVFEICYSRLPENLRRMVETLASLKAANREAVRDSSFVLSEQTFVENSYIKLETSIGSVDLLGEVNGLGSYENVVRQSVTARIFDRDIRFLTLDGLIKAKRAAGRAKDLLVLPELEALLEVLSESGGE